MKTNADQFPFSNESVSRGRFSRRSFLKASSAASAALALSIVTEPMLASAAGETDSPDAIMINRNENPLGPSPAARQAAAGILIQGGRYRSDLTEAFVASYAQAEGLKPEYVKAYPGSSGCILRSWPTPPQAGAT